ncbi:hypothetical protein [Glycomyces albidus]|jgi:hypothetical protein|uniref:Secreted protein n=1 Tax=Glycomyces albidus TaxID=2656774 RepID=A0A6L5GDK0_9ACTN|nr:hypothetical protein [Glycomyces albidus]MQM27636.1 hypothetical protein [Glycomyces albidus]
MRRVLLAAAALTALSLTAACSDEPQDEVASAGGTASEEASEGDAGQEEGIQAFAECMRDEGVDFPDPDPDGGFAEAEELREVMEAEPEAVEACQDHLASGEADMSDPEVQAALLEFSQCMRDNGVEDMPDPGEDGFGPTLLEEGPADPEWDAALEACQDLLGEVRGQ